MKLISEKLLNDVTRQAQASPRLRMNYNLHESLSAPIQRLLNALEPDTYLPPHRHPDKTETYLMVRGSLLAFFYDDQGNVTEWAHLSHAAENYGLEIPANTWHSIISLEPGTIIFEVKAGPYLPLAPNDIPAWAPANTPASIAEFRAKLMKVVSL
ncbi:MAG: WbuC family cupin fold metalloprotein [Prevotellaceae bacterium]|jgi:cupin fold WbuC family metalloprotein|nr:WbuC family cupin fold metalloprotein [Prevotellaceae bacterium]